MLKENRRWLTVGLFLLLVALFRILSNLDYFCLMHDVRFVYNRAVQMLSCIKDGNVPWFYYNDLLGVGYGTAFFYGQLTFC